ncbi:MAG: aminodeoxychorismate synthase component I [Planctomycetes bacterium]|nr:aminodeoxychorismate synthase component I [Planctomycetota bacterium]
MMGTLVSQPCRTDRFAPLVEELLPTPEPWDVFRRLCALPHLLFLDSAGRHSGTSRYSFITADPFDFIEARGTTVCDRTGVTRANPFAVLARRLAELREGEAPAEPRTLDRPDARTARREPRPPTGNAALPPFQGGAAGLFGYDLCHHLERLPRPALDDFAVPDMAVGFYDWVVSFDHETGRAWLVSTGLPEAESRRRQRRAWKRLEEVKRRLEGAVTLPASTKCAPPLPAPLGWELPGLPGVLSNFTQEKYLETVRRAIEYVHAGDCFQVNIAQRLLQRATMPPWELYERLRRLNPAPFAGYFDLGDFVIASASPERFLRVHKGDKGEVETCPIKGTRPRDANPDRDRVLRDELSHSVKDRAENVMIVDLLRNDLGRVCAYGSVRVADVCRLESHPYVHHLVSEVRGTLRPGLGPVDLLKAAFPGGSVTGAPKIRAMEIIAELEPTARGPYCGALGYIGFDGAMDSNLLIRTFVAGRGWLQFCVGGGIVADSDPEREYQETWHKAKGLLRALE